MEVIRPEFISDFLEVSIAQITPDGSQGSQLDVALYWYSCVLATPNVEVRFLCLCTVLEALVKGYQSAESRRLVSSSIHRQIKKEIDSLLKQYEQQIKLDEKAKYEIFYNKIMTAFHKGQLNQMGPLRANLEGMLRTYRVPYSDLFTDLKVFIDIRDKLAHEGLTSTHPTDECVKLHSLVVRVLLAFLGYEGNYQEYARTTVDLEATGDYHTQNKIFKLTSE